MKVVVCVEPWGLSEASRAALALAARACPRDAITALAASDGQVAEVLAEAQRLGAFRTAQVMETSLESLDVGGLGKTLAQALLTLGADLVLCGARSDGEGRGVVPAAVAHHWKSLYVPHIEELAFAGREAAVLVRSNGRKRRLAVPFPAVLTVGAALTVPASPGGAATPSSVEIIRLEDPGQRTLNRSSDLGTLEKPKRKPVTATSAAELLRRW
jgi:electron transfer flavoprotein alpha/beta subunit